MLIVVNLSTAILAMKRLRIQHSDEEMDLEDDIQTLRSINKRTKPSEESVELVMVQLMETVLKIKDEMDEKNRIIQECLSGIKKDKEELAYVEKMLKDVQESGQGFQTAKKSRRSGKKSTEMKKVTEQAEKSQRT